MTTGERGSSGFVSRSVLAVSCVAIGIVLAVAGQSLFGSGRVSDDAMSSNGDANDGDKGHSSTDLVVSSADLIPMQGGGPDRLPGGCDTGELASSDDGSSSSARITCDLSHAAFGGLYRQVNATAFRGKTVRLSGELKAESLLAVGAVDGVGSVWVRVEAPSGPVVDNGRSQGVRGSTEWTRNEVRVFVPEDATLISIGYWMQGRGQLSARNLRFGAL